MLTYEQNQEREAFIHVAEAEMATVAPELDFRHEDLYGFVSAAWTPGCGWTPTDAAAEFANSLSDE